MVRVRLDLDDPANRVTLRTLLESEGDRVVDEDYGVTITDDFKRAVAHAASGPTLVLASIRQLREAVDAMREGVHGYVFVPFVPGEVHVMVRRAANAVGPTSPPGPMKTLRELETEHILATLRACKNNQAKTARTLGIGRNTLWRKLRAMDPDSLGPTGSGRGKSD
jgi:DNA-binding NtrC family response regulator